MQAAIMVVAIAIAAYLVIWSADGWADWVVFGVIVLTTWGATHAIYQRRFPTRRRTFVRHSDSQRR
jgi:O-antigen/teichoic acid export membrane protein